MKNSLIAGLLLLTTLGLAGCDRITAKNYEKLEVGMPYEEVVSILGEPTKCSAVVNTRSCRWGEDDKYIDAKVVGESVIFLSAKGV